MTTTCQLNRNIPLLTILIVIGSVSNAENGIIKSNDSQTQAMGFFILQERAYACKKVQGPTI